MGTYSHYTNQELLDEYEQLDELINVTKVYGKKDVFRLDEVCHEMDRREE